MRVVCSALIVVCSIVLGSCMGGAAQVKQKNIPVSAVDTGVKTADATGDMVAAPLRQEEQKSVDPSLESAPVSTEATSDLEITAETPSSSGEDTSIAVTDATGDTATAAAPAVQAVVRAGDLSSATVEPIQPSVKKESLAIIGGHDAVTDNADSLLSNEDALRQADLLKNHKVTVDATGDQVVLKAESEEEIKDKNSKAEIIAANAPPVQTKKMPESDTARADKKKLYDTVFLKRNNPDLKSSGEIVPTFDFSDPSVQDYVSLPPAETVYYGAGGSDGGRTSVQSDLARVTALAGDAGEQVNGDDAISAFENSEVNISLENDGWIIKNIDSPLVQPYSRKNYPDRTWFTFKTTQPGSAVLSFMRYDPQNTTTMLRTITVTIKPAELFTNNKKQQTQKKTKKSEAKENYKKKLADSLFANGNYTDAITAYEGLIKEGSGDSEIYYRLGHSYRMTGNLSKAAEGYEKNLAEEGNPFYDDALVEYVDLLKTQQQFQKGVDAVYERGLSKGVGDRSKEQLYLLLGDLYFNLKNYAESSRAYRTFLSYYPVSDQADKALFYLGYSLELARNPDFAEAKKLYNELMEKYPESKYFNLSKSRALYIDRHYLRIN